MMRVIAGIEGQVANRVRTNVTLNINGPSAANLQTSRDGFFPRGGHASHSSGIRGFSDNTDAGFDLRVRVDGKFFARGEERLRIQGMTYGPFAPDARGECFATADVVRADFKAMRRMGVNALRLYHVPPEWFLELAEEYGMLLLVSLAWSWHVSFLDRPDVLEEAREAARSAVRRCGGRSCVLGYNVGNEISPDLLRWYGPARVVKFLRELRDIIRAEDPAALVTYTSFPPTEYLDLSGFDFATFNVYLHEPEVFRRYLLRLMIQVGDKPLVLGELGMDTFRHGENEQAEFLQGHLRQAALAGAAGAFVFSWTDDWHTGGHQVEDWAFGICGRDRSPKKGKDAVGKIFQACPAELLASTPRVSVVVCSYNGGATLSQCLQSLLNLEYPDFEVILVDDGSTDNTAAIAKKFPSVRAIHQANLGLSEARNVGLRNATGSVIAYTDSDCFVDPHWLTSLVYQLECTGAAAVGGPNLTPDDGLLASCVAASPGQPTHVLESDEVAEHVPGCNMAYRREALEAVNGFSPRYRKAGDDVDLCWRLQQERMWITFAPGAFVWHHRRQTPSAYLRQQAGYGEAEGLLWFDHPNKINRRGESIWRGAMYGAAAEGLRLSRPVIYHGIWGSGHFQTIYQPGAAHWATVPSTLEWQIAALLLAGVALLQPGIWGVVGAMFGLSFLVAAIRAWQVPLAGRYRGVHARAIIAGLHYLQPLVRSWWRYRTRLLPAEGVWNVPHGSDPVKPASRTALAEYWTESGVDRQDLLRGATACFADQKWPMRVDPGWSDWDLEVFCSAWWVLRISTTQEVHGQGKRRIRVRMDFRSTGCARVIGGLAIFAMGISAALHSGATLGVGMALLLILAATWRHGRKLAGYAAREIEKEALFLGLKVLEPGRAAKSD